MRTRLSFSQSPMLLAQARMHTEHRTCIPLVCNAEWSQATMRACTAAQGASSGPYSLVSARVHVGAVGSRTMDPCTIA